MAEIRYDLHLISSHSAIAYANGYSKNKDPYYDIKTAIPGFADNYKYLSGAAFTLPISVVGIFMVSSNIYVWCIM